MSDQMTKAHCEGCENNFYNGNNPLGVKECWSYPSAKLMRRKEVHVDQIPPWTQEAKVLPSCYTRRRFVYVKPDQDR